MKTEYIEKLKQMEWNRKSPTGYMINKERVYIRKQNLRKVTSAGNFSNLQFDKYIKQAIIEKEKELLERAFELEEIEYQEIRKQAKIEAANILAEQELI